MVQRRQKTKTKTLSAHRKTDGDDGDLADVREFEGLDYSEVKEKNESDFSVKDFREVKASRRTQKERASKARAQLLTVTFKTREILSRLKEVHNTVKITKGHYSLTQEPGSTTVKYWVGRLPRKVNIMPTHTHGVPAPGGNRRVRRAHHHSWADALNDGDESYLTDNPFEELDNQMEALEISSNRQHKTAKGSGLPRSPHVNLLKLSGDVEENPGPRGKQNHAAKEGELSKPANNSKHWDKCSKCKGVWDKTTGCKDKTCGKYRPEKQPKKLKGKPGGGGTRGGGRSKQVVNDMARSLSQMKGDVDAQREIIADLRESSEDYSTASELSITPYCPTPEGSINEPLMDPPPAAPDPGLPPPSRSDLPVTFSHLPREDIDDIYRYRVKSYHLLYRAVFLLLGARILQPRLKPAWGAYLRFLPRLSFLGPVSRALLHAVCFFLLYRAGLSFLKRQINTKLITYKLEQDRSMVETGEVRMEKHHHTLVKYKDMHYAEYSVHDDMSIFGYKLSSFLPHVTRRLNPIRISYELFSQLMPTINCSTDFKATHLRIHRDIQRVASINIDRGFASKNGIIQNTANLMVAYGIHLRDGHVTDEHLN